MAQQAKKRRSRAAQKKRSRAQKAQSPQTQTKKAVKAERVVAPVHTETPVRPSDLPAVETAPVAKAAKAPPAKSSSLSQYAENMAARLEAYGQKAGSGAREGIERLLLYIEVGEAHMGKAALKVGGLIVPTFQRAGESIGRAARYFRPSALSRHYQDFLRFVHSSVLDRSIEKYMFVPTGAAAELSNFTVRSTHRKWGSPYQATPSRVFKWALRALPEDLNRYTFVDFGAGRGRVLLMAAEKNFRKVTGTEFAQELYDDALMNVAQFPRSLMKCRDVDCLKVTATQMPIPDGPAVLYFFHPFDREVFSRVFRNVVTSLNRRPRPIYIVTVDYDVSDLIAQSDFFEEVSFSAFDRAWMSAFSPSKIRVFESETRTNFI